MDKKYFFFDIDGTLTDDKTKKIIPSAVEALKKLKEAGHFLCIASGRAFYKAIPFCEKYKFENMVCNGGHAIYYNYELRENRPLEYDKALAVYNQAIELGYGVLAAMDDSEKVYANSFKFYDQVGERQEPTTYIIDKNFDPSDYDEIFKLYVSISAEDEEKLTLKDTLGSLRYVKDYLMFQPDEKLDGIYRMLEYAGGKKEDVVVFGDDYNDMVMFSDEFYKVAMGNACEPLKEKADYVTDKNVDDGIYNACLKHGWFKE